MVGVPYLLVVLVCWVEGQKIVGQKRKRTRKQFIRSKNDLLPPYLNK